VKIRLLRNYDYWEDRCARAVVIAALDLDLDVGRVNSSASGGMRQ
jgi:hypothetical protein